MEVYDLKDSGVEFLGKTPKGWRVKRIKDFGKVIGGYAFKSSDFRQEGALILKISNVSHLSLKWDDISYLPDNYEIIYSDYVAPPNSLIFALTRPIIKAGIKTVKLLENESFLINQRVGFFKPSNKVNNSFLIYVTQSSGFVAIFENKITSSTIQPNISTEKIESIKFFCPPISEQKAIADYLDKACQNIDKTITLKQQQLEKLEAYRKSVIHEAVTKGLDKTVPMKDSGVEWLGNVPKHWRVRKLKRNFSVVLGKMIQPEQKRNHDKKYPYLRAANIDWSGIKLDDVKTMWFQPFEVKKYTLKHGDLLVSEGGDVGKCCIWKEELKECFYQNAINRVRPKQSNSTHFLYYWIYFLKHIGLIDSIVNRITIAHLTAEKLEALPVLICPPVEQKAIAIYLDKACTNIDKTKETITNQIKTLTQYRQSLIHECVTGKKRIYQG